MTFIELSEDEQRQQAAEFVHWMIESLEHHGADSSAIEPRLERSGVMARLVEKYIQRRANEAGMLFLDAHEERQGDRFLRLAAQHYYREHASDK